MEFRVTLSSSCASGALLSAGMAPRFRIQTEVDIPEGSMWVPEDAKETTFVLDTVTSTQRVAVGCAYTGALLLAALTML